MTPSATLATSALCALSLTLFAGCAQEPVASAPAAAAPTQATASAVPKPKVTRLGLYMHPKEVQAIMASEAAKKTLFLDIRSPEEVMFVGTPSSVDAIVPFALVSSTYAFDSSRKAYRMDPNKGFVAEVEWRLKAKGLTKNDDVILMCRSGDRSAKAADLLAEAGYTRVYSVVEGFEGDLGKTGRRDVNGWKNDALPWSYALDPTKLPDLR